MFAKYGSITIIIIIKDTLWQIIKPSMWVRPAGDDRSIILTVH